MAEFERVLGSLGTEGLKNAAAQLLQRLYPTLRASKQEESGGETSRASAGFDAAAWEKWAAEESVELKENLRRERAFPAIYERQPGARAAGTSYSAGEGAAARSPATEVPERVGAGDMRAVSDYFQRDSRRYDREFERY